MELDRKFTTDKSQYGFQEGIQVTQAVLSVLVAIQKDIEFIVVLDLAKAYDNILKLLMERKLNSAVYENLTNQLVSFLLTVQAQVSGDITSITIAMLRGLTQGYVVPRPLPSFHQRTPRASQRRPTSCRVITELI